MTELSIEVPALIIVAVFVIGMYALVPWLENRRKR